MILNERGYKPEWVVASRAGMSPAQLAHCTSGRRNLTGHQIAALARLLEVDPEELVGWADDPA